MRTERRGWVYGGGAEDGTDSVKVPGGVAGTFEDGDIPACRRFGLRAAIHRTVDYSSACITDLQPPRQRILGLISLGARYGARTTDGMHKSRDIRALGFGAGAGF